METIINVVLSPLRLFLGHPERLALVAAVILAFAAGAYFVLRRVPRVLAAAGVLWLVFAAWEYYCTTQDYDIRVDLLVIWPAIIAVTLWGISEVVGPARIRTRP